MSKEGVAYAAYRNQAADANEIAPGLKRHVVQAKASATFPEYAERMSDLAHDPTFSNMLPLMDRVFQNNVVLLNRLTDINNGTSKYEISGHMDLEHVGAFGHSFGSIISGMLAMEDRRIKAAIGLDAPQLNVRPAQYTPFRIPVCYAYADELTLGDETISFSGLNRPLLSAKGSCEALFKKSAHYNFTDLNQVKFLRYTPMLGNVDNALMAANLDALLLAFFDTHLKGKDELRALRLEGVELNLY